MSFVVPRSQFVAELREPFALVAGRPVVLHTNTTALGIIDKPKPRKQLLGDYWSAVGEAAEGAPLAVPTFNYDFTRSRRYAVADDPCQVGVLNEFVRALHPDARTRTPVFNFCVPDNPGFGTAVVANPFGPQSLFAELVERDGYVGFLSAGFESNTFLHHVEERHGIGYRYIKEFAGEVVGPDGTAEPVTFQYRVRPMEPGAVDYEWPRLIADLRDRDILREFPVGRGTMLLYSAPALLEHWSEQLRRDEYFLLTPDSRKITEALAERHGYPLTFERLENNHG